MFRLLMALGLASAAAAQGVLPLSQTMRFGSLGAGFAGPCGPNPTPTVFADEGTLTFGPDGRFALSVTTYAVCPGGAASTTPIQAGSGTYDVRSDGILSLEWIPAVPGADPDWLFLRTDGAVTVRSRHSEHSDESVLLIGVALSGGKDDRSLAGTYHLARLSQRNPAAGMTMVADAGTIAFDGAGGFVHQGTRRTLTFGGTVATTAFGPLNGSYSVAPDGTVTTGIGAVGAVSPDGDVFFWLLRSGTEETLTVGLRQGSSMTAPMTAGDFRVAIMNHGIHATALPGSLRTDWGTFTMRPANATGGTFDMDVLHVESSPTGTMSMQTGGSDTFDLSPDGTLHLTSGGQAIVTGAVSEDASLLVGVVTPGDSLGLTLGLSAGHWPTPIGSATPGSGGLAPQILPIGGFPYTGNRAFGLVVAGGRGGAAAALLLAADSSTGLPLLGGTVWVDPGKLLLSLPLQLSGPVGWAGAGAAGLPLAVPADPLIAGARFVGQAFVVDPGAPQGVAMSAGLEVVLCR